MPPSDNLLNAAEEQWLQQRIATLREFAGVAPSHRFDPAELDRLHAPWQRSAAPGDDTDQMITAFGAAFGQCLVDAHGWLWVRIDGDFGPDVAVQPQGGAPLLRPLTVVAAKYDAKETGYFAATCAAVLARATEGRRTRAGKPWWRFW